MDAYIDDPAILQQFLIESEELLQGLDHDLLELEASPRDAELLNRAFRALHTIKGTAGFLGLEPIVRVGHGAEDVLSNLRKGEIQLSQPVMDALLAARDQLGKMLADIRSGGLKEYPLQALIADLQAAQAAGTRVGEHAPAAAIHPEPPLAASSKESLTAAPQQDSATAVHPLPSACGLPVQSMRVDVRKLDELVNLIGELVLERNRLLQIARQINAGREIGEPDSSLSDTAARLSFITDELQAAGLRTRMVPMETVFSRFPRLVRDLARSLQKEADLEICGQETEIDKTMVELISDPLLHLIRNSLDHGLEMPTERERAGKPRRGKIRLEAKPEGDHILIIIADDGAGIDPARISRKAVEKGLITAERAARLSRREIIEFIFQPGFSTVEEATDVSGRGVGMDVVRSNLKKLNGSIEVFSETGKGTRIELRLPLTLAILPVLLVSSGDEIYALPLRAIIETARFNPLDVHRFEGSETICLRGETLPLLQLQNLFAGAGADDVLDKKVVIMSIAEARIALLVDRLIGQESTVVKPLHGFLSQCHGIAGATVGGDGCIRLVLDPAGLLPSARRPHMELVQ